MTRRSGAAAWVFSHLLLHAYPRAFRRRFGAEMLADFRSALAAEPGAAWRVLLRQGGPIVADGISERWSAVERWALWPGHQPHLYEPAGRHAMFWETLRTDLRHTFRLAARTPLFTTLTILALAIGIGATSAIFAVVNGVLLRTLPYRDTDRLVNVWSRVTQDGRLRNPISPANFVDLQRLNTTLEGLEGYFSFVTPLELATDTGSEIAFSVQVTPRLFELLGRTPALGRSFGAPDGPPEVVLSHGYWQRRFGGDPSIVGRTLQLSNFAFEVVGVMPDDFVFPYGGMLGPGGFTRVTRVDMWVPIAFSGPAARVNRMLTDSGNLVRNVHWWGAVGRLKPGITPERAEVELQAIAGQLEQQYPDSNKGWSATVVRTIDQTVGTIRPALLILLAGIACVLLMASVNVANLLLARAIARERELATRAALGAARARLVRQLLTESLLISAAGGVAALGVMWAIVRGLVAAAPAHLPRIDEVTVDWRVLVVTAVVSMVTGVLVGLAPALTSTSVNPQATLQDHSRGAVGGAARRRLRSALVVAEVALAVALTTGAGLLLRSFVSLVSVNPGFDTEHLLTWQMNLPDRLHSADERRAFYRDFFARMEALPGVLTAGGTTRIPLGSTSVSTSIQVDGRVVPIAELPEVQFRRAMHDYFGAMGIPIVRGRGFTLDDGPTAPPVAIINETMARRMFPGEEPLGQRVRMGPNATGPWTTIIGVIGDVRHGGLEETPQPELYITSLQNPPVSPFVVLKVAGDPAAIAESVRAEARAIDKDLPVYDMKTMATIRSDSVAERRFILLIVAAFGVLALGLAAIGVYGVMSLIVSERTREVAVRVALGAEPSRMVGLIVRQAATLAAIGVVIGLAAVLPLTPLLQSQLYGVTAADPMTLVSVPLGLLAIAALAALVPARRAAATDPLVALRAE
ncbi:MAG TPA: ABC transporter permease [Vicinamibacterales bacterium]|nr:ABC transporter permease [Vicinamibacterales bacterium]